MSIFSPYCTYIIIVLVRKYETKNSHNTQNPTELFLKGSLKKTSVKRNLMVRCCSKKNIVLMIVVSISNNICCKNCLFNDLVMQPYDFLRSFQKWH